MRYRPLGNTGMAISAISLSMSDAANRRAVDWIPFIYAALENGINAFEIVGRHPDLIDGAGEAFRAVDRKLLFVAWRLGWSAGPNGALERDFAPESLVASVDSALARTGLEYLDAAILDAPGKDDLSPPALEAVKALREAGRVRMLGVSGSDESTDAYISSGAFEILATPYNLMSGWKERLRLRAAIERDMAVIGYDYHPKLAREWAHAQRSSALARSHHNPLAGAGSYAFLDETPKWSAEEICLGYALTEPSLCSVQITADRVENIETLAAVAERELPPNVPAQIEMARFSPHASVEMAQRA
jgi:aryl-alcohol dehydrogenase-like predicted oxidoreductase